VQALVARMRCGAFQCDASSQAVAAWLGRPHDLAGSCCLVRLVAGSPLPLLMAAMASRPSAAKDRTLDLVKTDTHREWTAWRLQSLCPMIVTAATSRGWCQPMHYCSEIEYLGIMD
jgi:hypothetical protein